MDEKTQPEKDSIVAGIEFNPPPVTGAAAIKEKVAAAQAAMAGPERVAKWEQEEKAKTAKVEQAELEKKLSQITSQKEKLELNWITLDDKRQTTSLKLKPLLEEEKKLEEEEAKLEMEEARASQPELKKAAEEKRWQAQGRRHTLEEQKWTLEADLTSAIKTIESETQKYRLLLAEEDTLKTRLAELERIISLS